MNTLHPETERERQIYFEAEERGKARVLVNLFEHSDRKPLIRTLWAKAMELARNETNPEKAMKLKAYADGVLHCYDLLKTNEPALERHARQNTDVKFDVSEEDLKKYGWRSGH